MNILTYIGIAIGGLIAVGSTLGITLGIVVTIIYKIFNFLYWCVAHQNLKSRLFDTNFDTKFLYIDDFWWNVINS